MKSISPKPLRDPQKYRTIMGIDSSTQGVAWTIASINKNNKPQLTNSGKIRLDKIKDIYDRQNCIAAALPDVLEMTRPDHIFIEMPIFVKNPDTARKLSIVVGGILVVASQKIIRASLVEPATWKSYIGYYNLPAKFTAEAKRVLGVTEGSKLCSRLRKEQTQRIIKQRYPDFDVVDDDICDSSAIALYGVHQLSVEWPFEKNKETALPLAELYRLGLEF